MMLLQLRIRIKIFWLTEFFRSQKWERFKLHLVRAHKTHLQTDLKPEGSPTWSTWVTSSLSHPRSRNGRTATKTYIIWRKKALISCPRRWWTTKRNWGRLWAVLLWISSSFPSISIGTTLFSKLTSAETRPLKQKLLNRKKQCSKK